MRRKLIAAMLGTVLAAGVLGSCALAEEAGAEGGVSVRENEESITGYTADFVYEDENATDVKLVGGFQFYKSGDIRVYANGFVLPANDAQKNYCIGPDEWEPNQGWKHLNDMGGSIEMTEDEDGVWSTSVDLPGGYYLYQYSVSYDGGESWENVTDPQNVPACNEELNAEQTRSQFFIPYDEKQGEEEYYDWSWATPIEDESKQGQIIAVTYDGLDGEQKAEIYLPAGYDENRGEPYKVLYLSHGGGGNEGDWFYQGNAGNILDRLIADGECEEFVVVCMNNTPYVDKFNTPEDKRKASGDTNYYLYCYDNIKNYLIPYVEENYHVSSDAEGMAFAGLSNGAKLTNEIYIHDPEAFSYYGLFSGSAAWAWEDKEDYSVMQKANVYLAAGWADQLMMQNSYHTDKDKTLMGIKEKLDAAEITYNNGGCYVTVEGAHDWFTWPQIFRDYVSTTLWK